MAGDYRVVIFDLDDTLAVSKSPIEPRMAQLLARLLDRVDVCIISGGRFEQFDTQVLQHLPLAPPERQRLHLMPTCGTRYYRWREAMPAGAGNGGATLNGAPSGTWAEVYAENLSPSDRQRVIDVLATGAKELGLWEEHTWGEIIEDRGSQITFSALGQAAPADRKYAWDPDGTKKERLRAYAAKRLPDLEVRSGGSTSVDVTRKGIDKAYGVGKLIEAMELTRADVLFIGDRLDEGGNDYPVKAMGIDCIEVSGWQQTAEVVQQLLETPAGAGSRIAAQR